MTDEQSAAYVIANAIGGLIEALGMVAENQDRLQRGERIAYGEGNFTAIVRERGLHHNALIELFHGPYPY